MVIYLAALVQLSSRTRKQFQQPEPTQLGNVQRRANRAGVRWQIFRRLHTTEAGRRYDLSTSCYWQSTPKALSGTTSGSDWEGITLAEYELQHLRKNGFAVSGVNYHFDQDHRKTMFRAIAPFWHDRRQHLCDRLDPVARAIISCQSREFTVAAVSIVAQCVDFVLHFGVKFVPFARGTHPRSRGVWSGRLLEHSCRNVTWHGMAASKIARSQMAECVLC
jgi:hypothetical protein